MTKNLSTDQRIVNGYFINLCHDQVFGLKSCRYKAKNMQRMKGQENVKIKFKRTKVVARCMVKQDKTWTQFTKR